MECHSIKEKLSAYIENQLSPEEKLLIDKHLKTCSKCSLALEDLKKTIAYAQRFEEVEPPPWLTQKVMARVREEAESKKGILRKLFYPLHIKVPVEVVATIAIVVTTIYVFKAIQPEMKPIEAPSEQVIVSEQEEEKAMAEKDELLADKKARFMAPEPIKGRRLEKEADVIAGKTEIVETPFISARETTIPQETDKVLNMEVRGAKKPTPELKAMAERKKHSISFTVNVKELESAKKEIKKALIQLKGKIIKKEAFQDKDVLTTELNSKKVKEFLEKLRLIGEVKEKDVVLGALEGDIEIRIKIVKVSM